MFVFVVIMIVFMPVVVMSFMVFVWSWAKNFLLSTKYRAEMIFMNAKIWFSTISMIMKISIMYMSFVM